MEDTSHPSSDLGSRSSARYHDWEGEVVEEHRRQLEVAEEVEEGPMMLATEVEEVRPQRLSEEHPSYPSRHLLRITGLDCVLHRLATQNVRKLFASHLSR